MHERHASRSGGQRYRDLPGGGLEGTGLVADDLYLLGHDDRTGKPLLQPRALGTGLAGALLAELLLAGQISLRRDSAVVIVAGTPGDTIARLALVQQIAGEPRPQPVRAWLRFLARSAARDVALRLEAAGYLEHIGGRAPWSQGRWIPVNRDWAFAPVLRVRATLDPAWPLSAHGAALTGLAMACGLGYRVAGYLTQARRPVPDVIAVLGPGLRELIAQTQTAVDSAVLSHRS
jgi:Golgi phosphoprotein 3 (GPP34)